MLQDAADFLGYEVTLSSGLVEVRAAGLSLHRTVQKVIEMNPAHQVVFVGAAGSRQSATRFVPAISWSTSASRSAPIRGAPGA